MTQQLNYTTTGEGDAFVFQHGLGAQLEQAQGLFGAIHGFRLISMDCPGHGKTPAEGHPLPSFHVYADLLLGLLDKLGVNQAIFGGISMGSGISLNIALRYPEKVRALVLVRPAWLDMGCPANLEILLDAARYVDTPDGQARFESLPEFQQMKESLPNAARSVLGQFSREQGEDTPIILNRMVRDRPFDKLDELKRLSVPCLIIGNDDDPLHPWEMAEAIHQCLPGSQLEKVTSRYTDDAAHRKEVRQLVVDFVNNI